MKLALIGSLFAVVLWAGNSFAGADAGTLGEAFCKARIANDEEATRALLTPSLVKVIEEAEARSDLVAKSVPDEKPPLGDGIPYQAFPDVPAGCDVGAVIDKAGYVEVTVTYRFPDTPNADWSDRLKVVSDDGKAMVDDVIYANVANGEPDLSLRQILMDTFDQ